jgi:hypothetical protein
MSSTPKTIQFVLPSDELKPDRQALCLRNIQKLHRVTIEDTIHSHQGELMLYRLRDQQSIKRITVNGWKLRQMSHRPLVNWQRRDSMGYSLLRKIGCWQSREGEFAEAVLDHRFPDRD